MSGAPSSNRPAAMRKKRSFEDGTAGVVLDALDAVLVARGPESVIRCTDREFRTSKRAGRIPLTEGFYNPRAIIRRWAW